MLSERFGDSHAWVTGRLGSVSGRLLGNPGEVALMDCILDRNHMSFFH